MNHKLLALYGLKFNPFSPELPVDAIYVPSKIESFCWRIEHAQIREGGFAMVHGDPGSGKSIVLRVLAERLKKLPDVTVGAINHPQSNLADFYRELGDVFGVPLRPSNRWGGFKALRARWLAHMESTRCRAVLLVDEAQEMTPQVLSELRLLASSSFDSQSLLCIVMAGDARLIEKLRRLFQQHGYLSGLIIDEAEGMPSKRGVVMRLNFCVWTEAETAWLSADLWARGAGRLDAGAMAGLRCYGALDVPADAGDLREAVLAAVPDLNRLGPDTWRHWG